MGFSRLYRDLSLNRAAASVLMPRKLRWRFLRLLGMNIPGACTVSPDCWFGGTQVTIGRLSTINYGVFFDTSAPITIGERCDIGMQVMLCTSDHQLSGPARRAGPSSGKSISIGNGTWIGTRVVVLPGVTIGEGCVIAAGAVVASDCEPHGLYAGVPARRIRDLFK